MTVELTDLLNPNLVRELPEEALPDLLTQLAAAQGLLAARLRELGHKHRGPERAEGDRLLTAEEAAQRLCVAPDWLYRRAARLPFTVRLGRRALRFSQNGLERWILNKSGK